MVHKRNFPNLLQARYIVWQAGPPHGLRPMTHSDPDVRQDYDRVNQREEGHFERDGPDDPAIRVQSNPLPNERARVAPVHERDRSFMLRFRTAVHH
eukprot:2991171-Alexandrium_andersonii.AAC.1